MLWLIQVCIALPEGYKFNVGELDVSNMQCSLVSSDPSSNSYTMDLIYKDIAQSRLVNMMIHACGNNVASRAHTSVNIIVIQYDF